MNRAKFLFNRKMNSSYLNVTITEGKKSVYQRFWKKGVVVLKASKPVVFAGIKHTTQAKKSITMTEMCRMRSSSLAESLAGSSVGSGRFKPPSWWWMWKSRVPFSNHCCLQRTRGMSSELPEISRKHEAMQWKIKRWHKTIILLSSDWKQLLWGLIVSK